MTSLELIAIGTVVFFFASFVGAVTGGIGLVTNAVLIGLGVPPVQGVAAVKVGGWGRNIVVARQFHKAKKMDMHLVKWFTLFAAIGAAIGATAAVFIDPTIFKTLIGIVILVVSVAMLLPTKKKIEEGKERPLLGHVAVLISYILSSLTATGSGIIRTYVISGLFKKKFLTSIGTKKIPGLANRAVATGIFLYFGVVNWQLVVPMLFSGTLGGYLGTKFAIKRGEDFVRKMIVTVAIIFSIKILFF